MIWTETFNAQYLLVEVNCHGKLIVLAKANHAMVDELVYPGERSIALLNKTRAIKRNSVDLFVCSKVHGQKPS